MRPHILLLSILICCTNLYAQGQVINVPDDYPAIQEAIDASSDGDTVLVAEGTYYENISFRGKAITVASWFLTDGNETHIDNTIIDGSQSNDPTYGSVVEFISGEDTTSVLYGFTITGGTGRRDPYGFGALGGGGIAILSGGKVEYNKITGNTITDDLPLGGGMVIDIVINPTIVRNNYIADNKLISGEDYVEGGGAIFCYQSPSDLVYIEENVISNNTVTNSSGDLTGVGGGIYLSGAYAFIRNNLIVNNKAGSGGGIKITDYTGSEHPHIINNTIVNNEALYLGGGIRGSNSGASSKIVNSIIYGNICPFDPQVSEGEGTAKLIIEYSNVQGGYEGTGNIDKDPFFADMSDYYLISSSPCVDAGSPETVFEDLEDPGNPGSALLPSMGTLRNDMGAYGGSSRINLLTIPKSTFILSCSVSDTYLYPQNDTLVVYAEIFSPEDQPVEVKSFVESFDGSVSDTLTMFDDGTHKDDAAGDGLYTGYWPVPSGEEDYNITISSYLTEYRYEVCIEDAENFTTKGPVKFESLEVTIGSINPEPPERIKFTLTLSNEGVTDTVYDVNVNLLPPDGSFIINSTLGDPQFGDLAPGESLTSHTRDFALSFQEGCQPGSHSIPLEITSRGEVFWKDTLVIDVVTDVEDNSLNLPSEFSLEQNYPNPFNPATTIEYSIPKAVNSELSIVNLTIYDVLGRKVATLVNEHQRPGIYTVNFEASALSSGMYFYKLTADKFTNTKKMLLLR